MKPRESGSKSAATAIRKKFVSKEYIDAHFFFFFQKGRKRLSLSWMLQLKHRHLSPSFVFSLKIESVLPMDE
jgi:hypothetical protein